MMIPGSELQSTASPHRQHPLAPYLTLSPHRQHPRSVRKASRGGGQCETAKGGCLRVPWPSTESTARARLEAIASRLEAVALRVAAIVLRYNSL